MEVVIGYIPIWDLVALVEDYYEPQRTWDRVVVPLLHAQRWDVLKDCWPVYELVKHPQRLTQVVGLGLYPLWRHVLKSCATTPEESSTIDGCTFRLLRETHLVNFASWVYSVSEDIIPDAVPYVVQTAILNLNLSVSFNCFSTIPRGALGHLQEETLYTGLFKPRMSTYLHIIQMQLDWTL